MVTFTGAAQTGTPTFQLTYELHGSDALSVTFGMIPPDQGAFQPIATGTATRLK